MSGEHDAEECADPDCLLIGCVVERAMRRAIEGVNRQLGLQAIVTLRHDSVKCWVPDPEDGGIHKTYLSAGDCIELAAAFTTLASVLERASEHKGTEKETGR